MVAAFTQIDPAASAIPPRLISILKHFRQRGQTQEHAATSCESRSSWRGRGSVTMSVLCHKGT